MKKKQTSAKKKASPWPILLMIAFGLLLFFIDGSANAALQHLRVPLLDIFFGFFTNMLVVITLFLILPSIALLLRKKIREVFFLCAAFLFAVLIGVVLKEIIARPRPALSEFVFAEPVYYSFPSLHALIVFSLLPLLIKGFPALKKQLIGFALFIGFTRLYFGVHYLSDVFFGALIGLALGWYLSHEHIVKPGSASHFLTLRRFEIRRKMVHIALGLVLVLLIQLDILGTTSLGILTLLGFVLSLTEKKTRILLLSSLLDTFERKEARKTFPAQGMLFFLLGSFLAVLFFPKDIALAAIMTLSFGDAISHLFGVHFGRIVHPLTDKKFLEGALAGFIAATLGALLFVPAHEALLAGFVAMLVEGIETRWSGLQLDDNFLIPLAVGGALLLLRALINSPFPYL